MFYLEYEKQIFPPFLYGYIGHFPGEALREVLYCLYWAGRLLGHLIISMGVPVKSWLSEAKELCVFLTYAQRMWEADLICCVYCCCCIRELSTHISISCTWVHSLRSGISTLRPQNTQSTTGPKLSRKISFLRSHPASDPPGNLMSVASCHGLSDKMFSHPG